MTTKRTTLLAAAVLGAILLLASAGLVLGADPTRSPAASPAEPWSGGMMGGQGMMGGWNAADMTGMHEAMEAAMDSGGTCDPAQMDAIHDQYHPTR